MAERVVLVVDGNSLLHRGYHALAHTGTRTLGGEPAWAVRGLLSQLVHAVDRVGATHVVVGMDDPDRSLRRERHPTYKAQRPDKLPTLVSQLELAGRVLRQVGVPVVVPPGLEADDVLASVAARVGAQGGRTVVATSDRDAFALISSTTSVLRIINGGVEASPVLTPQRLEIMLGVRPEQYPDFAALRGDPSDNLPGVYGVGPKTAARLLSAFGGAERAFADLAEVRELLGDAVAARMAADGAREAWARNREVMAMHTDLDVDTGAALPLPADEVRHAYAHCRLPGTTTRALRALCGVDPPAQPVPEETLAWDPRAEWRAQRPERTFPPLPEKAADPQLTLF
ncbi:hypothetical protein GCM10011519_12900 [Marmoricola endophyticus]|uniref:5'-3' exonuclease n=1 Tax=Marmoricola endophyticus TaxID=2040280 RepID=A0A917F217_9ACTN|nr:5'-3' exonuclease H3TH domain-containing protein [Marmoricola endophyticus]GGF40632.1 hypothetical protein GCM10011519_12900 [Marmoricola endophyticus]